MHIKSYKSYRFAGLKKVNLEFDKGLNVILGPNESGKSTIINGIHSVLFKDIDVKKNNNEDLNFIHKFNPRPDGDSIDGSVLISTNKGDYQLEKIWGEDKSVKLYTPEENLIKNKESVNNKMEELLGFGERTYSNIVFAKQESFKSVLENISKDSNFKREITDILRTALMELDGVSIEEIEENIEEELNKLYRRWDIEKSYPMNGRGVNNKYKNGLGLIIESYYKKEDLKIEMEEANRSEKEFEEISEKLKEVSGKRKLLLEEKNELESIEDDIRKRENLEIKVESLKKESLEIIGILKKWPLFQSELASLGKNLGEIEKKEEELIKEKNNIEKLKEKKVLEEKLNKISKIEAEVNKIEGTINNIGKINKEDIDYLEKIEREILQLEASLNAGEIIAKLNRKNTDLNISLDFKDLEEFNEDKVYKAKNSINISNDDFEFQVKVGEKDFDKINSDLMDRIKEKSNKLKELNIESVQQGKLRIEEVNSKIINLKSLKREIEIILGKDSKEDLKARLEELGEIKSSTREEDIDTTLENIAKEKMNILVRKNEKENKLKQWEEKYSSFEDLSLLVGENQFLMKSEEKELEDLENLPERFGKAEDFYSRISYLREEINSTNNMLDGIKERYYMAKNNLLDESYEELKVEYIEADKSYRRYLERGEKLLKVKKTFLETKEKMLSNPMEPLVKEFTRLLGIITDGKYIESDIGEGFEIVLEHSGEKMPFDLLSAGTYDSVSLALRFALLNYLFEENQGFLILDDSLVDLDPERKEKSIKLIKDFSKKYQIIFTTCNPETAKDLGGNIIQL